MQLNKSRMSECVMETNSLQPGIQDFTSHNNDRHLQVPKGSTFSIHLASIPNGENVRFRPAIFIALMHTCSVLFEMAQTNLPYKNYDLSLYDQVNIAFIFAVINAQWYDKFRLPF